MLFIDNKYTSWYYSIINKAQSRQLPKEIYTERHHILPKSLGGSDSKTNLVRLTAREHFICHRLLPKMVTAGDHKAKMHLAAFMFSVASKNQKRHSISSRTYSHLKLMMASAKRGQPSPIKGVKVTDPTRLANIRNAVAVREEQYKNGELSRGNTGKYQRSSEYLKELSVQVKTRAGFSTKGQSPETRARAATNISRAKKGRIAHNKGKSPAVVSCVSCRQEVDVRNFNRWHGEKCKKKV